MTTRKKTIIRTIETTTMIITALKHLHICSNSLIGNNTGLDAKTDIVTMISLDLADQVLNRYKTGSFVVGASPA